MLVRDSLSEIAGLELALVAAPAVLLTAGEPALTEVPRYRLKAGEQLVYRGGGDFQYASAHFRTCDT